MREIFQPYYYIIVFLSMLYAFKKVKFNKTSFLIIIIFWEGLFQYIDQAFELQFDIYNFYKIFVVAYAVYITGDKLFKYRNKRELHLTLIFLFFSISFWISYFLSGGGIITILSQYLYKYGLVFILFHYFKDLIYNEEKRNYVKNVILQVLYIQVFLSIVKFIITLPDQIIIGYNVEAIVGSMSAGGAGLAVVIPTVALIFYWVVKNGNFTKKDWIIALSFIMISIASGKRQPIILFPIFLYLLFSYVKKGINLKSAIKYIPLVLILFYFGVKLNPSLNPDNKVWGSFDPLYVRDYVSKYYFGTEDIDYILSGNYDFSFGRGGGLIYYFNPAKLNLYRLEEILFGKGRYEVAVGAHGRFTKTATANYGIQHGGLMGEAGAILYSFGYIGALLMFMFSVTLISGCLNKKLAILLFLYYLWDFLTYYNQVVFSNQSAIIVLSIIFISFDKKHVKRKVSS